MARGKKKASAEPVKSTKTARKSVSKIKQVEEEEEEFVPVKKVRKAAGNPSTSKSTTENMFKTPASKPKQDRKRKSAISLSIEDFDEVRKKFFYIFYLVVTRFWL